MPTPHLYANTSPVGIDSGEITWNGPEIPCLGICTGMNLNKMQFIIASKVCEVLAPIDLSNLTLSCALDILKQSKPSTNTIQNIFQLLLDNDCHLNGLIKVLDNKIAGQTTSVWKLNLKCLEKRDSLGNIIPYTEESLLQDLINEICDIKINHNQLSSIIVDIQNSIRTLSTQVATNNISKKITTCVATNKDIFEQLSLFSADYCSYKSTIGDSIAIQTNISKLSADILKNFVAAQGFTNTPNNLADQFGNALIVINSLYQDILTIKNTCCKLDCNDISVAFAVEVDSSATSVNIIIKTKGTNIPTGFTSVGSILTISDAFGNSVEYPITITPGSTLGPFDILGLDKSKPLTANISAKFNNGSLFCDKCLNKTFNGLGSTCCTITNNGISAITVIYTTLNASNITVTNSQVLLPNAVFTLPPASKVIATSGAITSTCADLPVPEQLNCYALDWLYSGSGNGGSDPFETITIEEVSVNGIKYPINATGCDQCEPGLPTLINAFSRVPAITNVSYSSLGGDTVAVSLFFKTIPSISSTIEMKIKANNPGKEMIAYIRPHEDTRCI